MRLSLPRRRSGPSDPAPVPSALEGIAELLRLLPDVSPPKTLLVVMGVLVSATLPIGVTVATGLLVGSIPSAVRGGLESPAGTATLALLAGAAGLIVAARLLSPLLAALASTMGREVDRYLQERVMAAVGKPAGIAHLEDPAVLDLLQNAQGVGTEDLRPGVAVSALASLVPSWLQALGSALLLVAFHWWLALIWLVMWPVVVFYLQREYLRVGQAGYGAAGTLRRADYFRTLALTPTAAKELRIWGMLDWLVGRFDAAWLAAIEPTWAARHPGRRVLWLSAATVTVVNLVSFGLLAWAASQRELGLAALAVYTQAVMGANGYRAFDDANANLAYATTAVPSVRRLERRLVEPRSTATSVDARTVPRLAVRLSSGGDDGPAPTTNDATTAPDLVERVSSGGDDGSTAVHDGPRYPQPGNQGDDGNLGYPPDDAPSKPLMETPGYPPADAPSKPLTGIPRYPPADAPSKPLMAIPGPQSRPFRMRSQSHRLSTAPKPLSRATADDPMIAAGPSEGIRFEGVTFRYAGRSEDALASLDLTIPARRSLAIVGANGAGKTTLVKLLCRLYEPTGGRLTVDGVDLRDIDVASWRRCVAAIFQDFVQYPLSARENVALREPGIADDPERLQAAARKAGALDLVEALPRGWDTVLSRQYTEGVDLSGGQWQRIALARALFAVEQGARVLILDEPTASLDVRAEAELYDRFLEITAGLTTLLISHRFSTVRRADQIVVLADGNVVERGTHDELVALRGRYAEMFALQAARFTDEALDERGD